ncbi:MAG: T9SS type A sorting domain-containing protein [Mariniphaga sp.]|nr:T9SS type A sorting domain-containing protein [Mariniphaga sp.]
MLSQAKITFSHQVHHKSVLIITILLILLFLPISGKSQLSAGDIAFTGVNSDGDDQFSFIATTVIAGSEIIYFTDRGYIDETPGWNNSYEGIKKFTVPSEGLLAGDMVVISNSSGWQIIQGKGTIEGISGTGTFALAAEGDQLFAFQTDDAENYTPTFIAGIHLNYEKSSGSDYGITDNSNWDNISTSNTSYYMSDLPNTLTTGTNAIWLHDNYEKDNGKYNNTISQGTKSEILASCNNVDNWEMHNSNTFTLGYPSTTSTIASGNWNETSTWNTTNGIPGKITDVTISHDVTVTADCAIDDGSITAGYALTINSGDTLTCNGTLTINSDASNNGSLIVNGVVSGNVSYKRYITGSRWHMISSPVSGQSINSLLTESGNNIPQSESDYGMMDYNTTSDNWNDYFTSSTSGNLTLGKCYNIRRETNGTVTFTGTVISSNINVSISDAGNSWNLVGNPYPVAINATKFADATNNFLTVNSSNLDPSYTALYLWDEQDNYVEGRNDYKIINNAGSGSLVQNYLQSAQGFFVKARSGSSLVSFTTAMQANQSNASFKSGEAPWPAICLTIRTDDKFSETNILFNEQMTAGLDIGYDAGAFKVDTDFSLYTRLIEDNDVDFMVQCLPNDFDKTQIIPIGIDAPENTLLEFNVDTKDWPDDINIVLLDKFKNKTIPFNNEISIYSTSLITSGIGRFYLQVGKNISTGISKQINNILLIPMPQQEKILLRNIRNETLVTVFDISGKKICFYKSGAEGSIHLDFSGKKNGIYIVQIKSTDYIISKKISWMK